MTKQRIKLLAALLIGSFNLMADVIVYDQPTAHSGGLASQNSPSTPYTAYDDFTLASSATISSVSWFGVFFNPASHGDITGFTLQFYSDAAGQPGTSLQTVSITGNAGETSLGNNFDGNPEYSYTASISPLFSATAGTKYWLSIVADMSFPPQWGWERGTGGDNVSFEHAGSSGFSEPFDLAFSLTGSPVSDVPETSSLILLATVSVAIALGRRGLHRDASR